MENLMTVQWQEDIKDPDNLIFIESVLKLLKDRVINNKLCGDLTYIIIPHPSRESDSLIQGVNKDPTTKADMMHYGYKNRGLAIPFTSINLLTKNISSFFEYGAETLAIIAAECSLDLHVIKRIIECIMLGENECNIEELKHHYVTLYFEDNVLTNDFT